MCLSFSLHSHKLTQPLLQRLDQAGFFNMPIIGIIDIRHKVKEFLAGKLILKSIACHLTIVDGDGITLSNKLQIISKRPEAIFGATFVILSPDHSHVLNFVDPSQAEAAQNFIHEIKSHSLLNRYENSSYSALPTGTYALHPITKAKLPIFISDYAIEGFDTRTTHAHFAIPAHDTKDFAFAQKNNLEIKLVVLSADEGKPSSTQINKATNQLLAAYTCDYPDCLIINSEFLNGSIIGAADKVITKLQELGIGDKYEQHLLYSLNGKMYSINELQEIEAALIRENKTLSIPQQEFMTVLMNQVQADFLSFVEQFLASAKDKKELMGELIEESCMLRKNNDCYLLHWTQLKGNEPEKTVFKRDIKNFTIFRKFGVDLVNFLGDLASSCPHALENLKKMSNAAHPAQEPIK